MKRGQNLSDNNFAGAANEQSELTQRQASWRPRSKNIERLNVPSSIIKMPATLTGIQLRRAPLHFTYPNAPAKKNIYHINKSAQISVEYLIVISFVTFVVLTVLGLALIYSSQIQDTIKFNQLERFSKKTISAAESTFYSGAPSKSTITAYLPEGVKSVSVDETENAIIIEIESSGGTSKIAYPSSVPIAQGNPAISSSSGLKKILIEAKEVDGVDKAVISQTT